MSTTGTPVPDLEHPENWMIEPLDYMILDILPDEGTNVGLYQVGETTNNTRKKLGVSKITTGSLVARMRMLHAAQYIRQVRMVGTSGTIAYQKTKRGKEILTAWQSKR